MNGPSPARFARASAGVGGAGWLSLLALGSGPIERWIAFAVLVIVPLALPLTAPSTAAHGDAWPYRVAVYAQPIGALGVVASAFVPDGPLAVALASPWALVAGAMSLHALWRFLPRGARPIGEAAIDAGLVYVLVAVAALGFDRAGVAPLQFSPTVVRLTAVHFHYAGFALPVIVGMLGRLLPDRRRSYRLVAGTVAVGPGLVAVGITLSPLVEVVSAVVLAAAVVGVGAFLVRVALDRGRSGGARGTVAAGLSLVAAASVVATMALAVAYAYGAFAVAWGLGGRVLGIGAMLRWHGPINAVGFALAGLLGVALLAGDAGERPHTARSIVFSPLTSGLVVGADYPERAGVVGPDDPPGQTDDLDAFARSDFDPGRIAPAIREFYERTGEWDLAYRIRWHSPFRLGATLAMALTRRVQQLHLPSPRAADVLHGVDGAIVDIDDGADPRADPRFWVRTDPADGRAIFVVAYATQVGSAPDDDARYSSAALPLPRSTMTGILRPDEIPIDGRDDAGMCLTSRDHGGDEGLYLRTPLGPAVLPIHETFRVWPADAPGAPAPVVADAPLVATHEMALFGRRFLSIEYALWPGGSSDWGDGSGPADGPDD